MARIALAQIVVVPKQPSRNVETIIRQIERSRQEGAELVVFPEMAVPGYVISDLYEDESFVKDVDRHTADIVAASNGVAVAFGTLSIDQNKVNRDGRIRKYNSVVVAQNGQEVARIHKSLLPTYRFFDDQRHFHPLTELAREQGKTLTEILAPVPLTLEGRTVPVGFMLCEDMWDPDYFDKPARVLAGKGAEFLVNLSCSPWGWRKNDKRHRVVKQLLNGDNGRDGVHLSFYYVNNIGTQNNGKNFITFDGATTVYNPEGQVVAFAKPWEPDTIIVDAPLEQRLSSFTPVKLAELTEHQEMVEIYSALTTGLRDFFNLIGINRAVVGLSGGVDSAVVACLLERVLGAENVYAVNMPSKNNSALTKNVAADIAANLGINYAVAPIQEVVDKTVEQIQGAVFTSNGIPSSYQGKLKPIDMENIQARDRSSRVLAGIASKLNAVFTCNGNKTEVAQGYVTLWGDNAGAIAPLADVWKMQVFGLSRFMNEHVYHRKVIPGAIIMGDPEYSIVPSAELSPQQNVEEGKGDPFHFYYHDALLREFVEYNGNPLTVLKTYVNGTLDHTLRVNEGTVQSLFPTTADFVADMEARYKALEGSVHKRVVAPPIIVISKRAFGYDKRESIGVPDFVQDYILLKEQVLAK